MKSTQVKPAPLRAAIYARKSTDDSDRNPANKSVTRQIEHARDYAAKKGWTVDEDHIYIDDGISGAEYVNRPAFNRLLASLPKRRKPPFDMLIMSESSRLGRDMTRNAAYIVEILESGVRIFYYLTDEEEKADTPEQKVMLTLRSYASDVERVKAGQRSRDALMRKAAKGYNAGGVIFGYDNVPVFSDHLNGEDARKSHTDFKINEAQADVIRSMFRMYAAGYGHQTVAKAMNGDPRYAALSKRYFGSASPASPRKGTGSWAPSSVRAILRNERYAGVIAFGKHRKVYRHGTRSRVKQPEGDVLRVVREDLRIIEKPLWEEVRARLEAATKTYIRGTNGMLWGRPAAGAESKYLLTGFGQCGICDGTITMVGGTSGSRATRRPSYYYGCSYHQNRGVTVCTNGYRVRMNDANALVLDRARRFLTPEAIEYTVNAALEKLAEVRRADSDRPKALEAEVRSLRRQRENFLRLIADGKAPASIVERISTLDAQIATKEHELQTLQIEEPSNFETRRLHALFRERIERFNELLLSDVTLARQALRKLIAGRIEFTPEDRNGAKGYRLRWGLTVKSLMDQGYIALASPTGFEPVLPP